MSENQSAKVVPLQQGWRAYLGRGTRCLRAGDYAGASQAFERALEEAPAEPQVLLALGRERLRQGRLGEAEQLLGDALAAQPDSAVTAAALARLVGLHQGRVQEGLALIDQALAGTGEAAAPLQVVRGELLLELNEFAEARNAFEEGLKDPVSEEAARIGLARSFNQEGIALSEKGELDRAVFALKRAAGLDPEWSGPMVNLGVVFGRMGKLSKSVEAYEAALERDPENPVAYFNLATARRQQGQPELAAHLFEELLDRAPDYPHVRGALAHVLGELREFDRAIALFLEEVEIDPGCSSCWSGLGLAYLCVGSRERGEECLRRALELAPGSLSVLLALSTLYAAESRRDEALKLLHRARAVDPGRTRQLLDEDLRFRILRRLEPEPADG
jgi:protein O-GlcNAc transferase